MPTFGVTAAGFVPMRLADVQAALTALFQSAFGPSVDLDARTPLGQILGILAEQLANGWEIDEQVYGMYSPDTALGAVLDNLCSITNITRLPATYSQGFITITGSNGTVIPGTFQVSVSGNPTAIFQVTSGGIISGTTITLPVIATATGPLAAPDGSLTVIVTPVSGVTAVTNAADATVGTNTETDAALRIRRLISLSRAGTATLNGIYNALMNVSEVVQASVVENATDSVDGAGRPPHSFEAIVMGGADDDVAAAILAAKGAGIATFGTSSADVQDSQGVNHTVNFSRPTPVNIYLKITVTRNLDSTKGPTYPSNGDDAIIAAVYAFTGAAGILGREVVLSQLYTPINTVQGIWGIEVQAGLTGSDWSTDNLAMTAEQIPAFDPSRITVVHA